MIPVVLVKWYTMMILMGWRRLCNVATNIWVNLSCSFDASYKFDMGTTRYYIEVLKVFLQLPVFKEIVPGNVAAWTAIVAQAKSILAEE